MGIVMNMSSYEIERDSMEAEYGEEVLCAGWNPAVALVCQQHPFVPTNEQINVPTDLAMVNAELFLQRMYIYQR